MVGVKRMPISRAAYSPKLSRLILGSGTGNPWRDVTAVLGLGIYHHQHAGGEGRSSLVSSIANGHCIDSLYPLYILSENVNSALSGQDPELYPLANMHCTLHIMGSDVTGMAPLSL